MQKKLASWKGNLLSQTGKTTLIKCMLSSLPIYPFSTFQAPASIHDRIDAICRSFWWGNEPYQRKLHLLSWEKKSAMKKNNGGLAIKTAEEKFPGVHHSCD